VKKFSLVFLGSKEIGAYCLKQLLERQDELNIEIIGVKSKENKLDGQETVTSLTKTHTLGVIEDLDDIPHCDFLLSVQHYEILKAHHIKRASKLAVNLHMAPLPEYRGSNQFSFAIIDQIDYFGTTLHKMEEGIDNGDILFERRFPIQKDIWVEDLYIKTVEESKRLFSECIADLIELNFRAIAQSSLLSERKSNFHLRKEINELKIIDEDWPQEKKNRYIRATAMPGFEMPYFLVDGEKKYYKRS